MLRKTFSRGFLAAFQYLEGLKESWRGTLVLEGLDKRKWFLTDRGQG